MSTFFFIDGLTSEYTNAQLKALLAPFGVVTTSTVAHRRNTEYLSFGFVSMKNRADANAARVALHGTVLSGTALRVDDSISSAFGWLKKPAHLEPNGCSTGSKGHQ
jgi:RNA recognition motif-containing protein